MIAFVAGAAVMIGVGVVMFLVGWVLRQIGKAVDLSGVELFAFLIVVGFAIYLFVSSSLMIGRAIT